MKTSGSPYTVVIRHRGLRAAFISLFTLVLTGSCSSLIATYDHYAYTQTIDIKVELLYLLEQAGETFVSHKEALRVLEMKIEKVYEYEKGRPKNQITVTMWEKFKSPDHHLFGGFMKRWKEKGTLTPAFIKESSKTISAAIDQIIGLESGKLKTAAPGN